MNNTETHATIHTSKKNKTETQTTIHTLKKNNTGAAIFNGVQT